MSKASQRDKVAKHLNKKFYDLGFNDALKNAWRLWTENGVGCSAPNAYTLGLKHGTKQRRMVALLKGEPEKIRDSFGTYVDLADVHTNLEFEIE